MKIKYAFILAMLLIILSLGAVSASDQIQKNETLEDGLPFDVNYDDTDSQGGPNDDGVSNDDFEDDDDDDWDDGEYWDEDAYQIDTNPEAEFIYYLDDVTLASLTLPSDAYGSLYVFEGDYDDGDFLGEFPLVKGYAEVRLSQLNFTPENFLGSHYLSFSYEADDYTVDDGGMVIEIINYEFTAPKTSFLGDDVIYHIDLHGNITDTIEVRTLYEDDEGEITEGDLSYVEMKDGKADIVFSNLEMGSHSFSFELTENVFKREVELYVIPKVTHRSNVVIARDNYFEVDLPDDAKGTLFMYLFSYGLDDYQEFEIKYCGDVKLSSGGLVAGKYEILSFEIFDEKYGSFVYDDSPLAQSGDEYYATFKASNPSNAVITAKNFNTIYAAGGVYKIKVTVDGKPVKGVRVVFKIRDDEYERTTDKNGYASLKIYKAPGTYKVTIKTLGKSVTKTLTVKHLVTVKTLTVRTSANKLILQANLAKVNGKYLKNKKVTFKFNGKKYSAKTNSKGVAKITIQSSVLKKLKVGKKVTYQATYLKDTVKKTVKVKR
ncbi:hypothetical protein [uncultured Methanobrevibacter sp.]|uniref:hypothetical protein n=1 Tax=uncultured Methanobrevibacter sp. TaxID=253161 RepID=UPI0025D9E6D6|nr:hypothetical protein [uncultured Methanobrevibacter sp.]